MDPSQMMEALQALLRQTQEEAENRQDEKRKQEEDKTEALFEACLLYTSRCV